MNFYIVVGFGISGVIVVANIIDISFGFYGVDMLMGVIREDI